MTVLNLADALKVGSSDVDRVYAGTELVWPTGAPEPTGFAALAASLSPDIWLRLDETSGTVATDSSGNGFHGTYGGTPTRGATSLLHDGDSNSAVSFNADAWISLPNNAPPEVGPSTSLFLRAKPATLTGTKQLIARRFGTETLSAGFTIRMDGASLVFYPFPNFSGNTITYGALVANQEYSVGLSYNTTLGRYEAYLNGALVGSRVTGHRQGETQKGLSVGASSNGAFEPFRGVIDEVLYWNTPLSATDHAALHAAAIGA